MDIKDIAKEIRVILANSFYKTKFSVKISRFSQGSSADITWTDGPTEKQVNELVGHFGDTRSKFINTTRLHSATLINGAIAKWKEFHPSQAHLTLNCVASGLDHYAAFDITEFGSNNPDLPLYEQSIYEIVRHSILDETGIRVTGDLISNEELVKLNELTEPETETQETITPIKINSLAEPIYIQGNYPSLNKCNTIQQYIRQEDNNRTLTQISKIVELSSKDYREFLQNLLHDHEWLNGEGGSDSFYKSPHGDNSIALINDKIELKKWLAERYTIALLVTNGSEYILVDPQGCRYARYVGFGVEMTLDDILKLSEGTTTEPELEIAAPEPESNLVPFKKPVPSSTPTPAQNPQSSEDVSFIQIYEAWVKKLITQGELNKIKSFDDWYAIASQVL